MYSLTFRVRVTTSPQYGRNGTAHEAGTSISSLARGVFAGMRSAWHCVRRAVGLAYYRWALPHTSSIATATQPLHRLQIRPIVHNKGASPTTPASYTRGSMQWCRRAAADRQINRHTDARYHNTFRVVYDSREV